MGSSEEELAVTLDDLQKKLGKKNSFEDAVTSIQVLLHDTYPVASPPLKEKIYSVVCRVGTILQTRYTAPGFWVAGLRLFEETECLVSKQSEKENMRMFISRAREHMMEIDNQPDSSESARNNARGTRYLFEGHLTVGSEPPPPTWLVAQNLITVLDTISDRNENGETFSRPENDGVSSSTRNESVENIVQELVHNLQEITGGIDNLESVLEASLREIDGRGAGKAPPASKEVVANLPIIDVTNEILEQLGREVQCAVCREQLMLNDKMQELPCKHLFHPPCLKPWLDEHNSCPICRYELRTDDHVYESRKEREREAEEERKGAANALRGGEYMYV